MYLPVHVKGAKFSVGDLHFSQGDGEISFCGAIEMAGIITIKFNVMKNGMADLGLKYCSSTKAFEYRLTSSSLKIPCFHSGQRGTPLRSWEIPDL